MKNHQPHVRVVAWVLLKSKIRFVRLSFPRAHWSR
jgi:hypothetical protein